MFNTNCAICGTYITQESQEKSGSNGIISVVTMIDNKSFWYGLEGVYEFQKIPKSGLKKGDEICNNCMKENKDNVIEVKTIPCSICKTLYQPTYEDTQTQAWGCAASCYKKNEKLWISVGWGSKHDCSRFEVVVPVVSEGSLVCDKCIDDFVEEGSLVEGRDKGIL